MTSFYKKTTVSTWSSGTGMAGVAGSFAYAGMISLGLSSRNTLLVLLLVPALWAFTFWGMLKMSPNIPSLISETTPITKVLSINQNGNANPDQTRSMSFKSKLRLVLPLWKYMLPLFFVYFAEYTINQGLYELLYYEGSSLSQAEQYRWLQVDYQVAVFLSRSSVSLFHLKKVIIPTLMQWAILIFLLCEVCFQFIPYIGITFLVVFLEGLCGGSVYVNAFYMISQEVAAEFREFSMGVASMADAIGTSLAAGVALSIHDALCKLKK